MSPQKLQLMSQKRTSSMANESSRPTTAVLRSSIPNIDILEIVKQSDSKMRINPRNSFFAQKFKKAQNNRPFSSNYEAKCSPGQERASPRRDPTKAAVVPFFVHNKSRIRNASKSLVAYHAELMSKNGSEVHISPININSFREFSNKLLSKKSVPEPSSEGAHCETSNSINSVKLAAYKRADRRGSQRIHEKRQSYSHNQAQEAEKKGIFLNYGQNLNIRSINPKLVWNVQSLGHSGNINSTSEEVVQNSHEKLLTEQLELQGNSTNLVEYQSAQHERSSTKKLKKISNTFLQARCSPSPPKKRNQLITNYFGKLSSTAQQEQIQRLKCLYYRDLIWKIAFNWGWKIKIDSYSGSREAPRYFVGQGNNSKLVRAIMGRRWWWKPDTKEDGANFLWTQLKIYSAYQKQKQYDRVKHFESEDDIKQQPAQLPSSAHSAQTQTALTARLQVMVVRQPEHRISSHRQQPGCLYDEDWWDSRKKLGDKNTHLLTLRKYRKWEKYISNAGNIRREGKSTEGLQQRRVLEKQCKIQTLDKFPHKVTNHLEYSRLIGNKKALYKTMSLYYELSGKASKFLPMTYHITSGLEDHQYLRFLNEYYRRTKQESNSMWIVKPGEMSNRGCGIKVCQDIQDIKAILKNKKVHTNGKPFTYIIQEYLREPFLYQGRKFDIRHYIMIGSNQGRIQGYWYQEGYIRTTSYKYSNNCKDSYVHLTNDAVQKYCKDYGKYQKGNKVSYEDFEKYLASLPDAKEKGYSFYNAILPRIREISMDIMKASYYLIDPKRKAHNFEIFGLDVMIDADFRPWLIEVNTNPCLELSSPVLARVIPRMLDNAFAISLDPLFPPPADTSMANKKNSLPDNFISENRFQLAFDEVVEGRTLNTLYDRIKTQLPQMGGYGSDQEAYESAEDDEGAQY